MPGVTFWRRATQAACFVFFVYGGWLFLAAFGSGGASASGLEFLAERPPVVNAYPPSAVCRFTAHGQAIKGCILELLSKGLTEARPLAQILPYLTGFLLLAFLAGRMWCGWVCPLGALGDLFDGLRVRFQYGYWRMAERWRAGLRATSYCLFAATLAVSWIFRPGRFTTPGACRIYLPFCKICPARLACPAAAGAMPTWWGGFANDLETFFTILSYATLAFFVAAFLSMRRMWCHACPIGLVNSWFNRGGGATLQKEATRCNRCGACADGCPMGLTHVRDEKKKENLNTPECIFCLRCVELCPREKCLTFRFFGLPIARSGLSVRKPRARASERGN